MKAQIRELGPNDVDLIVNYFLDADRGFLDRIGVDPGKLPQAGSNAGSEINIIGARRVNFDARRSLWNE